MDSIEQLKRLSNLGVPLSFHPNILNNPTKCRDIVEAKCSNCGKISKRTLSEHKRVCSRQSKHTDKYHCSSCLQKLDSYVRNSPSGESWREECRVRSSDYWNSLSDEQKESIKPVHSNDIKAKISKAVKEKFKDPEYVNRIKKARKEYWNSDDYRRNRELSIDEFIKRSKGLHGDKYDYSKVVLRSPLADNKIIIVCPEHGEFSQRPLWHCIYGNGCPKCNHYISSPHQSIIDYLNSIVNDDIKVNDRSSIGYELDIFMPSRNFAIEFHGNWFHSHSEINGFKKLHFIKSKLCEDIGVGLFQIYEHQWNSRPDVVKSIIANRLGLSNKVYARKCSIKPVDKSEYFNFFDFNHLYGGKYAHVAYGLYNGEELLQCMSFDNKGKYWEISRLATKIGFNIVGGVSRLFNSFLEETKPDKVVSYADRSISLGHIYLKLGFELVSVTKPGYKYYKCGKVFSRQAFQKHKLRAKLSEFDDSKTEMENMFNNGYRVIWDAGHNKYQYAK